MVALGWVEEQHAKPEQAKYQETDSAWSDAIAPWLDEYGEKGIVRTSELFDHPLHFKEVKDIRPSDYGRLARVMVGLGWKQHRDKDSRLSTSARQTQDRVAKDGSPIIGLPRS